MFYPVHGDLPSTGPVNIYYHVTRPPGFGGSAGITMNRDIYVVLPPPPYFAHTTYKQPEIYNAFYSVTRLLIHELQHVKQYHDYSYNLFTFAHAYLYEVCKAGSYRNSKYEAEAYNIEGRMDNDLTPGQPANLFFLFWRTVIGLKAKLGFPVEPGYRDLNDGSGGREKRFTKGVLQLRDSKPGESGQYCYRTYDADEIYYRDATCTQPTINMCVKKRSRIERTDLGEQAAHEEGEEVERLQERAQDTRVINKDGEPIGGDPDGRKNCRPAKSCDQLVKEWRGKWTAVSNRAWNCNSGMW